MSVRRRMLLGAVATILAGAARGEELRRITPQAAYEEIARGSDLWRLRIDGDPFGNPGSGKTHLLCAIGQELIARGRRMYFTTSARQRRLDHLNAISAGFVGCQ